MKKEYNITADGKVELEKELADLKSHRGEIAQKIADARAYGDLSENAEYDAAREEQGVTETRIAEIEEILHNAKIISGNKSNKVILGSKVEIKTGKKSLEYTVVGPVEADPLSGKISNESPTGKALMGKKKGDKVSIETPKGEIEYIVEFVG